MTTKMLTSMPDPSYVAAFFGLPTECLGVACPMKSDVCTVCRLSPENKRENERRDAIKAANHVVAISVLQSFRTAEVFDTREAKNYVREECQPMRGGRGKYLSS